MPGLEHSEHRIEQDDTISIDYTALQADAQREVEAQTAPPAPEVVTPERSPISFAGGMGHNQERNQRITDHFRSLGHEAVEAMPNPDLRDVPEGYRVVSAEAGSQIMRRRNSYLETAKLDTILISSLQQEERAKELIAHLERQEKGPVTHIAQSADAQNAILAAYQRPDLFDKLVLLFPSGMVKKQVRTEYMRQVAQSFRRRGEKIPKPVVGPDTNFETPTSPNSLRERFQSAREKKLAQKESGGYTVAASAISAYSSRLLSGMRHGEQAPGVAMVLGTRDKMMKPDRILESLISANDVDYVLVTNTSHGLRGDKGLADEVSGLVNRLDTLKVERQAAQSRGETFTLPPLRERLLFMPDVPESERERLRAIANAVPAEVSDIPKIEI